MSNPTAKQIAFLKYMRDEGCCVSSEDWRIQMHHPIGRSAKVKGVGNIGHWFVIPLAWRYHDVDSNDPLNVTHNKNAFIEHFKSEGDLWRDHYEKVKAKSLTHKCVDAKNLPSMDVVEAIQNYRR